MWSGLISLPSSAAEQPQWLHWCWILALLSVLIAAECWSQPCQDAEGFQGGLAVLLFAAAQTDLTGRWDLTWMGSGLTQHHFCVFCSLMNSLQSAVLTHNIPFQPRSANLRVIGCSLFSDIFRSHVNFVRVLSFPHWLFLSPLQRYYLFLTGIPVAVLLTYINIFVGECSVRAKQSAVKVIKWELGLLDREKALF